MAKILGAYLGHDLGACLLEDGVITALIEEERLTRIKNGLPRRLHHLWPEFNGQFGYFPWASVAYCLRARGLGIDDLDALVLPPLGAPIPELPIKERRKILVADKPKGGEHHYMHALSAFFASPFERAAVLVLDGDGTVTSAGYEAETGYVFDDRRGRHREIFKNRYPFPGADAAFHGGLGWMYDYVSALLGFVNTRLGWLTEAGKTMGLAPYGKPTEALAQPWLRCDGYRIDFSPFHRWLVESGMDKLVSFTSTASALVRDETKIPAIAEELAWKAQAELEGAVLHLAERLHAETGAKHLCLAGGVALNSVANGLLLKKTPFEQIFVQPAAGDNGQVVGLAYYGHLALARSTPIHPIRHAYGGRPYTRDEVAAQLQACGLSFRELASDAALAKDAAEELRRSRIVGWFQGGSEYGPRALGNRSILADPRQAGMKDHLNARVKFRESFRPFAPSVLRERAQEVFSLKGESPYMLMVAPVRKVWRAKVPAIAHVDGSARIQTVDSEVAPLYHALIAVFAAKTGVPLLLNTSFNLRGMPIVETPFDAIQCFVYTEMDCLYLGRFKVSRPTAEQLFPSLSKDWRLVIEERGAGAKKTFLGQLERRRDGEPVLAQQRLLLKEWDQVSLCMAFDGMRSFRALLEEVLERAPTVAELARHTRALQAMARAGAVQLRIGARE